MTAPRWARLLGLRDPWWTRDAARPPAGITPPVPGKAAPGSPAPGRAPAPGPHRRGDHAVTDAWECGCIYSWTRATGWVHGRDCLDARLREFLS
jgi:hypothetical protein